MFLSFHQRTPLHIAVKKSRVMTVKFLVDKGTDTNSKDNAGVSMLEYVLTVYFYSLSFELPTFPESCINNQFQMGLVNQSYTGLPKVLSNLSFQALKL